MSTYWANSAYAEAAFTYRHYVSIPPGPHLLSEMLISSPVLAGDRGIPEELMNNPEVAAGGAGPATNNFEFGVDPSLDPELAEVRPFIPYTE